MNWPAIILAVFMFLLFLAYAAVFIVAHRRMKPYYAALEALKTRFQGHVSKLQKYLLHHPCFKGSFSGADFSVSYYTGSSSWFVFGLGMACKFKPAGKLKIFMYEKNPGPVFLAKRINPGDHDFDKYFIFSNMPEEAMHYFADDSKRDNIRQLLANGWQLPLISGRKVAILSADRGPKPQLDPALVESTLRNLIALQIGPPGNSG